MPRVGDAHEPSELRDVESIVRGRRGVPDPAEGRKHRQHPDREGGDERSAPNDPWPAHPLLQILAESRQKGRPRLGTVAPQLRLDAVMFALPETLHPDPLLVDWLTPLNTGGGAGPLQPL